MGKASKIRAKNTNDYRGGAAYLADLVIRRPMKLLGTFEVVLNLRTCLELRLQDGLLLSLIAEKLWEDHGLDDCPMLGPPRMSPRRALPRRPT